MPPTPAPVKLPTFDRVSFLKYVKNIGRPYRKQAMALISISRAFFVAQDLTFHPCGELESALQFVDDALMSAAKAGKKTSKETDEAFKVAVNMLSDYERKFHSKSEETVSRRMEKAEEEDKSSLKVLNRLKEAFCPLKEEPTKTVEFLLHKSLPDKRPTIVKQALCRSSNLNEVLWNFGRFKDKRRLTLKQNPHFYDVLPEKYGSNFRTDPIETFQRERISVLTDNSGQAGRVYIQVAKKTRVFGNVWALKDAFIFKDIFGALEGESIIGSVIQDTPNLWCFEEPPRSYPSQTPLSPTLNSSSPTATATPTTSPTGDLIGDWKGPIRRMMSSKDVNIRISPDSPTNSSRSDSALPSPFPPSGSDISLCTPLPDNITQSRPPIKVQIPGPSAGPPILLAPPSPELRSTSFCHLTAAPSPTTIVPPPMPPLLRPPSETFQLTGPAIPCPTVCLLSEKSRTRTPREESRKEGGFSGHRISSQAFNADVPTLITSVTITSPLQVMSPIMESDETREDSVGRFPGQYPDTEDEDDSDAASVQTVTLTSNTRKRRRRWYQRCIEVVKKNLRRGLPRRAMASTPNLAGHGVHY